MILTDDEVKQQIVDCLQKHKRTYRYFLDKDIVHYIEHRFNDSESFKESIYRIVNDIEERPTCPVCGGCAKFTNNLYKGFLEHCSKSCADADPQKQERTKRTNQVKYGCDNVFQNQDIKEKIKQTNQEKFGCSNPSQNQDIKDKVKSTNRKHFGTDYPAQNKEVLIQMQTTCFKNYGVKNPSECEAVKQKISDSHKLESTKKKMKQTNLQRYGYEFAVQNPIVKQHQINTKRKNHSFNSSKIEEKCFSLLCEKFGSDDVKRQYSSVDYPFACDFYIQSKDLYIECNFHWTHGGHPFNPLNESDQQELLELEYKSNNSRFYKKKIEVWTQRDPLKFKIAKENHLNYKSFYAFKGFTKWLKTF